MKLLTRTTRSISLTDIQSMFDDLGPISMGSGAITVASKDLNSKSRRWVRISTSDYADWFCRWPQALSQLLKGIPGYYSGAD